MGKKIAPSKLHKDIHKALKLWHNTGAVFSPFEDMYIFRHYEQDITNIRASTNSVLFEALNRLEVDYALEAQILCDRFLTGDTIHNIANKRNSSEAAIFRKQKEGLEHLSRLIMRREQQAQDNHIVAMEKRLDIPTYVKLIGIEKKLNKLTTLLSSAEPPWLVLIEGLGGIGKSSLADAVSRHIIHNGLVYDFGWVSAREHILNLGGGLNPVDKPALTAELLIRQLITQLIPESQSASLSYEDAVAALKSKLKQQFYLIVVDNLETVGDIEKLIPVLHDLSNPSKFLLTSRASFHYETGLFHFKLAPLKKPDVLHLIQYEARLRNLPQMGIIDDEILEQIYDVTGGNPLALRLVIGQAYSRTLTTILAELKAAQGEKVETLYSYIYRQIWDNLDEWSRRVLLAMPMATPNRGGTIKHISKLCMMETARLNDALTQLVSLNLVDSRGTLNERYYTIHNLTRTFLHEQVAKWA